MVNIWGLCEHIGLDATGMTRWDSYCNSYSPKEVKGAETVEKCCASCAYWLASDEDLMERRL